MKDLTNKEGQNAKFWPQCVVILSGGMDSTTLLYDVIQKYRNERVVAISFNYNQKHAKEIDYAARTCAKLNVKHLVIPLDVLNKLAPSALTRDSIEVPDGHYEDDNMKLTVVPNRNMVMLSLAAAYAISIKAGSLYYGAHAGDHEIYPDCRKVFVDAMAKAIGLCDWHKVKLFAPYALADKGDIAIKGKELGVDYSLTWTCYKGGKKACGKCGACQERLEAFKKAGITDPIEYE